MRISAKIIVSAIGTWFLQIHILGELLLQPIWQGLEHISFIPLASPTWNSHPALMSSFKLKSGPLPFLLGMLLCKTCRNVVSWSQLPSIKVVAEWMDGRMNWRKEVYDTSSGKQVKKANPKSLLPIGIPSWWNEFWKHLRVMFMLLWVNLALKRGSGAPWPHRCVFL